MNGKEFLEDYDPQIKEVGYDNYTYTPEQVIKRLDDYVKSLLNDSSSQFEQFNKTDFDEWLHKNNFKKQRTLEFVWNDIHILDYKFVLEKYKEYKARL